MLGMAYCWADLSGDDGHLRTRPHGRWEFLGGRANKNIVPVLTARGLCWQTHFIFVKSVNMLTVSFLQRLCVPCAPVLTARPALWLQACGISDPNSLSLDAIGLEYPSCNAG